MTTGVDRSGRSAPAAIASSRESCAVADGPSDALGSGAADHFIACDSRGGFVRPIVVLSAVSLALGACSSTYHPEYHPVTISNVAYPVMVNNGGSASERAPTYIVASPSSAAPSAGTIIVPAPANEPPPGFFSRE
jgi:hypothetical protein